MMARSELTATIPTPPDYFQVIGERASKRRDLRALREGGEITIHPATYRLVLSGESA